jgi:hypothetical protein
MIKIMITRKTQMAVSQQIQRAFGSGASLAQNDPQQVFGLVLSRGTEEGKLYALCGIRATDRASFARYAAIVASTNAEVRTLSGCIGSHEPAADVVGRIAAGVYDQYLREK